MAFTSKIAKLVSATILREPAQLCHIRETSEDIRRELSKISMRDNYIEYIQTERKLVELEAQMTAQRNKFNWLKVAYEYSIKYGLYAILTLVLIIISIVHRYTPVLVFGENFRFEPFGKVLNFPTGVPNAVSTVFWIVVNNFVARTVAGYVE